MATVSASHYSSASVLGTSSTFTKTSTSFTPTANSLLVVVWWLATDIATSGETLTITSTHSDVGAWSTIVTAETLTFGTFDTVVGIAAALVGASPGSGTITATHRSGTNYRTIAFSVRDITEVVGLRSGQTDTETSTDTTPNLVVPASMLSTSVAVSATFGVNDNAVTLPSGWSDWGSLDGDGDRLGAAYNAAPSGTTIDWADVGDGTNSNPSIVAEFAVAGHPVTKRWGGVAFAGAGARGRW